MNTLCTNYTWKTKLQHNNKNHILKMIIAIILPFYQEHTNTNQKSTKFTEPFIFKMVKANNSLITMSNYYFIFHSFKCINERDEEVTLNGKQKFYWICCFYLTAKSIQNWLPWRLLWTHDWWILSQSLFCSFYFIFCWHWHLIKHRSIDENIK